MPGVIPVNANPIKLTAYSTAGLPITYKITSGEEHIILVEESDGFYVFPKTKGTASITATAAGDSDYLSATPVIRTILVIEHPEYSDQVIAVDLQYPSDVSNVQASLGSPPDAPVAGTVESCPLEPIDLTCFKSAGRPSEVFAFRRTIPEPVTNVLAGEPISSSPTDVFARILTLPVAPEMSYAGPPPPADARMNYAINITHVDINPLDDFTARVKLPTDYDTFWVNENGKTQYPEDWSNLNDASVTLATAKKIHIMQDPLVGNYWSTGFTDIGSYATRGELDIVAGYEYESRPSLVFGEFTITSDVTPIYNGVYNGPHYGGATGEMKKFSQWWELNNYNNYPSLGDSVVTFIRPLFFKVWTYIYLPFNDGSNKMYVTSDGQSWYLYQKPQTAVVYVGQIGDRAVNNGPKGERAVYELHYGVPADHPGSIGGGSYYQQALAEYKAKRDLDNPEWLAVERNKAISSFISNTSYYNWSLLSDPMHYDPESSKIYCGDVFSPLPEVVTNHRDIKINQVAMGGTDFTIQSTRVLNPVPKPPIEVFTQTDLDNDGIPDDFDGDPNNASVGNEFVVNGRFTDGLNGWTVPNGTTIRDVYIGDPRDAYYTYTGSSTDPNDYMQVLSLSAPDYADIDYAYQDVFLKAGTYEVRCDFFALRNLNMWTITDWYSTPENPTTPILPEQKVFPHQFQVYGLSANHSAYDSPTNWHGFTFWQYLPEGGSDGRYGVVMRREFVLPYDETVQLRMFRPNYSRQGNLDNWTSTSTPIQMEYSRVNLRRLS